MNAPTDDLTLSPDSPLENIEDDLLQYAPFAEILAKSLSKMPKNKGMVVSINGPWGCGKTTIINFIKSYMADELENDDFISADFNPWWYPDRENLARLVIGTLRNALNDCDHMEIKSHLAKFGRVLKQVEVIPGAKNVGSLMGMLDEQPDLQWLKERLDKIIDKTNLKVIVFVDDIDRLAPDEIDDLFRVLKSTSSFHNVIYVLAFDTDVVEKSLDDKFKNNGRSYLEKIVQASFPVPPPDKQSLIKMLLAKLSYLFNKTDQEYLTSQGLGDPSDNGLENLIRTPRDVARLTNALMVTYPGLENEVNAGDYLLIEAIRVFLPDLYDIIKNNSGMLTGATIDDLSSEKEEFIRSQFEEWLKLSGEYDPEDVKKMLSALFPRFEAAYKNVRYGNNYIYEARKELRIFDPQFFPTYFKFSVGKNYISTSELKLLIKASESRERFENMMLQFNKEIMSDNYTKSYSALFRIEYYIKDVPEENIYNVVGALFNIGDKLLTVNDDNYGITPFFSTENLIGQTIYQLTSRISDVKQRSDKLLELIKKGKALCVIARSSVYWINEHVNKDPRKEIPEKDRLIGPNMISDIRKVVTDNIEKAAKDKTIFEVPHLKILLHDWEHLTESNGVVGQWIQGIINNDDDIIRLSLHFGENTPGRVKINSRDLRPFIDSDTADNIIIRIDNILGNSPNNLSNNEKKALISIKTEIESIQFNGLARNDALVS